MPEVPAEEVRLDRRRKGHLSWAATPDRQARTEPGRTAFHQRFLDQAGGDEQRAESLMKAHMAGLALASARSRRLAREALERADSADQELRALGAAQ